MSHVRTHQRSDITGAILVGGKSSRMGRDKASLTAGGKTFLDRNIDALSGVFSEILVVGAGTGFDASAGTLLIHDIYRGCGPLGGIHSALHHARSDAVFVVACDMPFLSARLIRNFLGLWKNATVLVAREGERVHPLFGIYTRRILPQLESALSGNRYRIMDLLAEVGVEYADRNAFASAAGPSPLANINTPEEYDELLITPGDSPPES